VQEERDHLVKFVFPELRRLCERRGVVWGEVDLRWGLTEEQSERGEVLHLCLEEISRCRPYFIGIVGSYYGTHCGHLAGVPPREEGWPVDYLERSVTEIEFIHGVLANPAMAESRLSQVTSGNVPVADTSSRRRNTCVAQEVAWWDHIAR